MIAIGFVVEICSPEGQVGRRSKVINRLGEGMGDGTHPLQYYRLIEVLHRQAHSSCYGNNADYGSGGRRKP